jgi:PAS domain S-box-containing protein
MASVAPAAALARAVEAERTLRAITSELAGVRDPGTVLQQVVRAASRLVRADGAILARYDPADGLLHWGFDDGVRDLFDPEEIAALTLEIGVGLTGRAVAERRVLSCGEGLIDAFPRVPVSEHFFEVTGFRSLLVAPIASADGLYGALEVYAAREHAFDDADAGLLEAFAAQAAIAFENARLIAELEAARGEAARRADEERTLREIAARVIAIADPVETLEAIVAEARRLLGSDIAAISLSRPVAGRVVFSIPELEPDPAAVGVPDNQPFGELPGVWGRALAAGRPVATGDYMADASFVHDPRTDARVAAEGLRSAAAAPIPGDPRPVGSLQVASRQRDAFGPHELELLGALASQAASAVAMAMRVADLAASRAELAHRAEVERALREISARVSASHDVDEVVGLAIEEATRLLGGDSARVDVFEPSIGLLRGVYTSEGAEPSLEEWPETPDERSDQGLSGQAYSRGETVWTGDYLADASFPHASGADTYVRSTGIRSVISAPLLGEGGPFGALTVMSRRTDAFGPEHRDLLEAIAAQVAISLATARLIDDLDRSRAELARRVEREEALREIGARLMAVGNPEELLRRIVAEARRLVAADGSRIDLLDETTMRLRWAYADGDTAAADARLLREGGLGMGEGVAGRAAAEGHAVRTGDYMNDPEVRPSEAALAFVEETGVRSVLSTPLPGLGRPLGTLSVLATRVDAFSDADVELLDTFALQASIAITNSRRLQALARATEENARRAATERALREIAARIGELRDPAEIVQLTVDEAARLLGADGARVDVIGSGGIVAALRRRLGEIVSAEEFRMGFPETSADDPPGVAGMAARLGHAFGTGDYLEDRSFERLPEQDAAIRRLGIRSVLAAPIRGEEGPLGALTVLARAKDAFDLDASATLEALASLAAAALRNATLLERVTASETRLRDLVATSPDLIWECDAEGRLTFVSGLADKVLGRPAADLVGRHFAEVIEPSTLDAAMAGWEAMLRDPAAIQTARFALLAADGTGIPIENVAIPLMADGRFVGARGAARDVRERERLERELRESEERYRDLVQTSPDGVWQADASGGFTFWSDTAAALTGFRPEAVLGRHWSVVVGERALEAAVGAWDRLEAGGEEVVRVRLDLVHRDGTRLPMEVAAVPILRDGRFAGAHGSLRDLREQLRLERELRDSEARFRELVQTSPDGVWQTNVEGRLVFWSDAARALLGWEPEELMERHWSAVIAPHAVEEIRASLKPLATAPPDAVARVRSTALRRDATEIPAEISGVPLFRDGQYRGIQGTIRDLRPQVRLERELREQAGALAASAERAHLARELHDSVTQALFSMGLIARSIEVLLDRDPAAARAKLTDLGELQRDALAEMRSLIFELRPGSLEREGLASALRTHVAAVEGRLGLPIVLDVGEVGRLPLTVEDALYRIAQEALHNIVKHARAGTVRIELTRDAAEVRLGVVDDGVGFDPRDVPADHLGLAGMRSRAERIGGRLEVRSAPGRGTEILAAVPVEETAVSG